MTHTTPSERHLMRQQARLRADCGWRTVGGKARKAWRVPGTTAHALDQRLTAAISAIRRKS